MAANDSSAESGWELIQRGLLVQKKEHADVQQKLKDSEVKLGSTRRQVETLTQLNNELRQRNRSFGEDCEKLAQALSCSKTIKQELETAHEQLKQAFSTKKKKLEAANTALATSYQNAEELRNKLASAGAKIAAYSKLFDKAKNLGGNLTSQKETFKQEPEEFSAMDETCVLDDVQPPDDEDGTPFLL